MQKEGDTNRRNQIEKKNSGENKRWFLEKIYKSLVRQRMIQITNIRDEMGYHYRPYRHQKYNKDIELYIYKFDNLNGLIFQVIQYKR